MELLELMKTSKVSQEELAAICGVSQQAISKLVSKGVLPRDGAALEQVRAYRRHLEYEAAKRLGAEFLVDPPVRYGE